MITGDNVFTAKAIATECGILRPHQDISEAVVEGEEFRNYTPEERMEKVDKICVMARSSPFDKLLMVECLKQKGHVVAVTGDGTNDAPALKEADVGLSMGIQGTEVAKESSDIVIMDDNFASVAIVLRWGRCVYNNIQKFIQFQLTVNVAALVINFVAAVSAGEVPLTAVQLLWVNLIMDTLGALALATEKPTKELMKKPPVGESIFSVTKKVNETLIFNTFVLCQVFNEFNARKLEKKNVFKGIHRNKLFLGIIAITIVLQVLPKDEKDIKTSTNMLVVIEDNAKVAVDFALVSSHGMQQATGDTLSHHLIHGHLRNPLPPRTTDSHVSFRRPQKHNNKPKKNSHKRRIALEKSQKKLAALVETLNPIPFLPSKTLDFQTHQKLLRRLGLWDFVHIDFDRALRADLLTQLIVTR
uniref:Cation-transporting P-type ATPase C-terminal domain-containing protein n=1 Tax=Fagus sylvatica TaxID=28930 RepID=A0A2N9I2F1_FAGSY